MSDEANVELTNCIQSEGNVPDGESGAAEAVWNFYQYAVGGKKIELPPSPGYAPFLTACGMPRGVSEGAGPIITRISVHMVRDAARKTTAVRALRFLSIPRQSRSHILKQLRVLSAAYRETTVLQHIFDGDVRLTNFVEALQAYESGDQSAYEAILSIAAWIAPTLSVKAGPKPKLETIAHQLLEQFVADVLKIKPPSYTWSEALGECCDPMTEATRREFGNPDFDPRPAIRIAHRTRQLGKRLSV